MATPTVTAPNPKTREPAEVGCRLRVTVVVLSWNARDEVLDCLSGLSECRAEDVAVVLVDNGSIDGTEARVQAQFPWVECIQNGANLGFAGGNNVGLRWALQQGSELVLLLNADARLDKATLNALSAHLEREPAVAAVQPLLVRMNETETVDSAGHQLTPRGSAAEAWSGASVTAVPNGPQSVFGACAAAVLLRTAALRQVGLFDPGLFILFEDVDLMFRLRAAGWDVHLLPAACVRHRRGISNAGMSWHRNAAGRRRHFWLLRNNVALALRYTPMRRLLPGLPRLLLRMIGALLLSVGVAGHRALPLWWRFLRQRRASRRGMTAHGVDRFYSTAKER